MVIYLRHPEHGNKVAIAEAEAAYDEKNGWERYDAGALLTPVVHELIRPRGRPRKELVE